MNVVLLLNQMALLNEALYWLELQIIRQYRLQERLRGLTSYERQVYQCLLNKYSALHRLPCPVGEDFDRYCRDTLQAHHRHKKFNTYLDLLFAWVGGMRSMMG